jgi:hypothetical protein
METSEDEDEEDEEEENEPFQPPEKKLFTVFTWTANVQPPVIGW